MLKEQFTDGVVDPQLRRDMRRFMFEHKGIAFSEFRKLVLLWSDDGADTSQCKVMNASEQDTVISEEMILKPNSSGTTSKPTKDTDKATSVQNDVLSLLQSQQELLQKQQKQLDMLSQMVTRADPIEPHISHRRQRKCWV